MPRNLTDIIDQFPTGKKFRSFVELSKEKIYWDLEIVNVKYHPEGEPWVVFKSRKQGNEDWIEDDGDFYDSLMINLKEGTLFPVESFEEPFSNEVKVEPENKVFLLCSCQAKLELDLGEEFNYKDVVDCDCGRKFLIADITAN